MDDQIMVMGGTIGFGVATQEVEVYKDARDAWTKVNPMNSEKDGLAAVTFDHYLLSCQCTIKLKKPNF